MVPWPRMGRGTIFVCRGMNPDVVLRERWILNDAVGIVMVCHP